MQINVKITLIEDQLPARIRERFSLCKEADARIARASLLCHRKIIDLPDGVELAVFNAGYSGDDIVALDWEYYVGHACCAVCTVYLDRRAVYDHVELHLTSLTIEGSGDAWHREEVIESHLACG